MNSSDYNIVDRCHNIIICIILSVVVTQFLYKGVNRNMLNILIFSWCINRIMVALISYIKSTLVKNIINKFFSIGILYGIGLTCFLIYHDVYAEAYLSLGLSLVVFNTIDIVCVVHSYTHLLYERAEPRDLNSIQTYDSKLSTHVYLEKGVERENCIICLEDFKTGDLLVSISSCAHIYHKICINNWLVVTPVCPICRNSLDEISDV